LRRERLPDDESVPQLAAFEEYRGFPVLLQTALVGDAISPAVIRRNRDRSVRMVVDWLTDFHVRTRRKCRDGSDNAQPDAQGIEQTLGELLSCEHWTDEERNLIGLSGKISMQLAGEQLPTVFEYGDLSHPNLLQLQSGKLGVIDWELAEPDGMPGADLFTFLAYAACASQRAGTTELRHDAFLAAFFSPGTWATSRTARSNIRRSCIVTGSSSRS